MTRATSDNEGSDKRSVDANTVDTRTMEDLSDESIREETENEEDLSEIDLEAADFVHTRKQQRQLIRGPRVRDQSRKFSNLLLSKTELHRAQYPNKDDSNNNENEHPNRTPLSEQDEQESSGLRYLASEVQHAREHGGDYGARLNAATRAAVGSLTIFSALVFPHQDALGAVWIGNIFMHSSLKDSLGASMAAARDFFVAMLLTTMVSFPLATFLDSLHTVHACIILPVLVMGVTFVLMSCPQLKGTRNLMILVMYIIIGTVVREEVEWWEPLGWTATYAIGLTVAILANVLPIPLPNSSIRAEHIQLKRFEQDFIMLLRQCKHYAENSATTVEESRGAIASIEMLQHRICKTVKVLKAKLPAAKTELHWSCRSSANLAEWVEQAEKLLTPLKSLRTALTNRVLGEDYHARSPALRSLKGMINDEVAVSRDRFLDAMVSAIAVCNAWADPSDRRVVLPDVKDELESALQDCKLHFEISMQKAAHFLRQNDEHASLFAHISRRNSSFNALFELAESLLAYLNRHNWVDEIQGTDPSRPYKLFCQCFGCVHTFVEEKWLWHNPDSFRLALKTAVGMFLASLFVSIPYLYELASPFQIWPGLTIASVNLATTGSSFHKAGDRMFGTLLAAAYALLVTDLFPGNHDYVKIPCIGLFTFAVIYLKTDDHSYKYTYAATSIGSMLYGSVKNDFNVEGYIPKRIELIFTGVVIFTVVELFLFPRSSRKRVEVLSLRFFTVMRDFAKQSTVCAQRMQTFVQDNTDHTEYIEALLGDAEDPFQLQKLSANHSKLKDLSSKLKKELQSGLDEPHIGFSLQMDSKAYHGLSTDIVDCEVQAILILKSFQTLAKAYRDETNPLRRSSWPARHADFMGRIFRLTEVACHKILKAYPDGRLRPQEGNAVRACLASSSLREFQDVQLYVLKSWSNIYSHAVLEEEDVSVMTTISVTTTHILTLCKHLEHVGKHVETIAHSFPASSE